jgi:hypothetical protein
MLQVAGAPNAPADATCGTASSPTSAEATRSRHRCQQDENVRVRNVDVVVMAVIVQLGGGARNTGNHDSFRSGASSRWITAVS